MRQERPDTFLNIFSNSQQTEDRQKGEMSYESIFYNPLCHAGG